MARRAPKLDTYAKQQAYKAWQEEQAQEGENPETEAAPSGRQRASGNGSSPGAGFAYQGPGAPEYPAPTAYHVRALQKNPSDRTLEEQTELKTRARAEEMAGRQGMRVKGGGVSQQLIAEDVASAVGKRDATAAIAYRDASAATLKAAGRDENGAKLPATPAGGGYSPAAPSGGQDDRPAPGSPGITHNGFAMRTMADGTVRGASPDGNGGTTLKNFGTQDEALAYYRPNSAAPATSGAPPNSVPPPIVPTGTDWRSQAARISIGQPMQGTTPAAPTQPTAPAVAQAPVPPPAPTTLQTPEAAKTTSPTMQLQMNAPSPGTTPPVATPVPTPTATPASLSTPTPSTPQPATPAASPLTGVSNTEILAQMTGARNSPGQPNVGFGAGAKELLNRGTQDAVWNSKPIGPGGLYPTPPTDTGMADAIRARDANTVTSTNREMGTPRRTGYQAMASDLNPFNN